MAYEPTNWVNGITPVNETNLNKIEQGIKDNADNVEVINALNQYSSTENRVSTWINRKAYL